MVKNCLLALLARRPMHGYELREELASEVGNNWALNFGQIYTTLERLERDGLVIHTLSTESAGPDRKVYNLTAMGRDALSDWFLTPARSAHRLKNELFMKLILSLTAGSVKTDEILRIQRNRLLDELHELMTLKSKADPVFELPWMLLLDSAVMHAEADIRWLEMAAARLDRLKSGTARIKRTGGRRKTQEVRPETAAQGGKRK